jgi:hypothetical protein
MVANCKFLSISRFSQGCDPVGGVEFDRKAGDHRQTGRFSCRLEDATDGNGQQVGAPDNRLVHRHRAVIVSVWISAPARIVDVSVAM